MNSNDKLWIAVRSLYRSPSSDSTLKFNFEERIVLFRETSFEHAIRKAKIEAESYTQDSKSTALEFFSAFQIDADEIEAGTEVYSIIRDSDLSNEEYIDTFYDTGTERTSCVDE